MPGINRDSTLNEKRNIIPSGIRMQSCDGTSELPEYGHLGIMSSSCCLFIGVESIQRMILVVSGIVRFYTCIYLETVKHGMND